MRAGWNEADLCALLKIIRLGERINHGRKSRFMGELKLTCHKGYNF